ncbi:hypothetical protein ACQP1K_22965 [Sphaerimonospora sp. CA-214678]|uniref:hypothetical protein n=1 Tax=Sphaerimonospora sp. CA-214678 TaxID=3240029 RepID=UPI003D8ADCFD
MTTSLTAQPLTGRRSRGELVAELYERHAAGLFAYCHDQLGETTSAADAVVAVFAALPFAEPPRAVLYALARREIYRRDVSYAMPAVDSAADPATALIERVFRDIRPHQREVLLLSAVCGLTTPELSLVLDVAQDTAEDLTAGARHRFTQTMATAVSAARSAPFLTSEVAEVYDAIGVAPIEDVLARLPWHRPAGAVRGRVLSSLPSQDPEAAAAAPPLPIKRLWPTAPSWPLPLSAPDQVSNTCVFPAGAVPADTVQGGTAEAETFSAGSLDPTRPRRRAKHEATTEPMPKLRGSLLTALTEGRIRRRRATAATPPAVDAPADAAAQSTRSEAPVPAAPAASDPITEPFDAFRPLDQENAPKRKETGDGRRAAAKAVSIPVEGEGAAETRASVESGASMETRASMKTRASVKSGEGGARARSKRVRNRDRHYDWAWELVGFLICLAITLLVFFALPNLITP